MAIVEVETLLREYEERVERDMEENRRHRVRLDEEREERADRRWAEATAVSPSMLGRQFVPRLGGRKVNDLLAKLGLHEQKADRTWAFTEAGLKYTQEVVLDNGWAAGQRAWTKEVLALLQTEMAGRARTGAPPR